MITVAPKLHTESLALFLRACKIFQLDRRPVSNPGLPAHVMEKIDPTSPFGMIGYADIEDDVKILAVVGFDSDADWQPYVRIYVWSLNGDLLHYDFTGDLEALAA